MKKKNIYIYIYISEVGGVFSRYPNREIDFDCACVCVACVRSCVRGMSPLCLGVAGLENPGVPPSGLPSGPSSRAETTPLFLVIYSDI